MKWIIHVLTLGILTGACTKNAEQLADGIYLIAADKNGNAETMKLRVHPEFLDKNDEPAVTVVAGSFVPLVLAEEAKLIRDGLAGSRLLLNLELTATESLRDFTAQNINRKVAIVVNGSALTVHKVRDTIRDGKLQVTRCSDTACANLQKTLSDNVK